MLGALSFWHTFLLFYLLSLFRSSEPVRCHYLLGWGNCCYLIWIKAALPPHWRHRMFCVTVGSSSTLVAWHIQEWNCMRFIPMSWDPVSRDNNEAMRGFFGFIPKMESNTWEMTILPIFLLSSGSNFQMCIASFASSAVWDFSWSMTLKCSNVGNGWPLFEQCW